MKYKRAESGHVIEVGDVIWCKNGINSWNRKVHRVTKIYAFVRYNDVAEGKFPRKYEGGLSFYSVPRPQWKTNNFAVYTPIEEKKDGQ